MLQWRKNFSRCTQNIVKKAFDNIVTGNETWVYYFEPKRKVANQIWATKNARCPSIAKRIRMVKKVFMDLLRSFCRFFRGSFMFFLSCVCYICLCVRLFICALWSPAGKGLSSWLLFVVSNCEFVTFPLVTWVRCGT